MTCFPTAIGLLVGLALLAWIIVRAILRKADKQMEGY